MKHVFVINPEAGVHGATDDLRRQLEEIGPAYDWEIYVTKAPKDATAYVRARCEAAGEEPIRFYACGGDGTLNEVINGAVGFPFASVGCYACGSGNDFVKIYGGKERFRDARALMDAPDVPIDLIRIGERYSVNVTNFGFDTCVAKTMIEVKRKKIIGGKHAYVTGVVKAIFTARRNNCTVEADGEVLNPKGKMLLCTIANGQYVGGAFRCAPKSDNQDGYLEVCLFRPITLFRFLFQLMKIYTNGEHIDSPKTRDCMEYRRAKSVHVVAPEGFAYSLDGEIVKENDFVAEIAPGAARFAVPVPVAEQVAVPEAAVAAVGETAEMAAAVAEEQA